VVCIADGILVSVPNQIYECSLTYLQTFPDDDWWLGEYQGKQGLFPSNYVELHQ
jgi:hypothetical protein